MGYSDCHAHLARYAGSLARAMVAAATAADVTAICAVTDRAADWKRAASLAAARPEVRPLVGHHPLLALPSGGVARLLRRADATLRTGHWSGIGEVGLDAESSPPIRPATQQRLLEGWLDLAERHRAGVNLHVRGADAEAAALLRRVPDAAARTVVHYFVGDLDRARTYLGAGCLLSFGRYLLRPEGAETREVARWCPADRLLLETDTYPVPGRATAPADVAPLFRAVARLRGEEIAVLQAAVRANLDRCFPVPVSSPLRLG